MSELENSIDWTEYWKDRADKYLQRASDAEANSASLQQRVYDLTGDLVSWLQLARRQYKEMPHNEPLCPTSMGIAKTEKLLGLTEVD